MKAAVFFVLACCAVSVLSLAEKPSASMSPGKKFGATTTTTAKTTTTTPKTTTTTAKTTTTTAKTTTTTPKTTTTTAKTTTTTPKTTPTTTPKTTPTTTPKTTPTTTPKTTPTTTPKTTPTMTPKTTPTTTPKTTPTTTPKTTPTTTPKTSTTTTPQTTSTTSTTTTPPSPPKPTPPVNVTRGNYNLTRDKTICLMAQVALQIRLATTKVNGTFIVQPKLTTVAGGCQETNANLTLLFKEGYITFMFNKNVPDNAVYVDALSFRLSYPFSNGGNGEYAADNKSLHLFAARVGHSYSCKSESVFMGNGLYLDVTQDKMQAFNLTKSNDFGLPDQCAADRPDYRVAIAVGVTLLVLIIIVVVAYVVSRRKRSDGYQSL